MIIIQVILALIGLYLFLNVLYIFAFSMASAVGRLPKQKNNPAQNSFLVLIPAFKGDEVILETARQSLLQEYNSDLYKVLVIADQLQPKTIDQLRSMKVDVVEVKFEKSTKAKSLNAALESIDEADFDYALILDIDNHMAPNFLQTLNNGLISNPLVVQAHRVAKNLDTDFAVMDAISEEINNSIFRKGHRILGLSSALIGSGIAMKLPEFKALMKEIKAIGGFDKEMEVRLLRDKKEILYLEDALVYDEKVQDAAIFENQRRRWLSAQFVYLRRHFLEALKMLVTDANLDYFNKVFQFLLLPRVMLLGLTFVFGFLPWVWPNIPNAQAWQTMPILTVFSLALACPKKFYNRRTLRALRLIPKAFSLMFRTIFRLKGANKSFIHTPHSKSK